MAPIGMRGAYDHTNSSAFAEMGSMGRRKSSASKSAPEPFGGLASGVFGLPATASGPSSLRDPLAWLLALLAIFVAGYSAWWALGLGDAALAGRFTGAAAAPGGVLLALIAIRVTRTSRLDRRTRLAWAVITIGLMGYGLGAVLHFVVGTVAVFGVSWPAGLGLELAAYPIIALALGILPKPARTIYDIILFSLDVAIVVWSASILIWHFVVYPVAQSAHQDVLAAVGAAAFPVFDLALVFTVGAIVIRGVSDSSRAAFGLAGIALLVVFCGDMVADTEQLRGVYVQGGLSGFLYSVAWVGMAMSAYLQWRVRRKRGQVFLLK